MTYQAKPLKVIRMGHPTLAAPARPVDDPTSEEIHHIIANMTATLNALGGESGLAATQVDIPLRIFIFCVSSERLNDDFDIPLTPVINPVIEYKSQEMEAGWEGCFSVPDMIGEVKRPVSIRYRYQTPTGESVVKEAHGFHARVVQHETDHLDGIFYVQRIADLRRFGFLHEMKNRMKEFASADNIA